MLFSEIAKQRIGRECSSCTGERSNMPRRNFRLALLRNAFLQIRFP